ncbi:hypothetical protein Ani05nite_51090 [Amorphoplanes nipponensis]|uniref:Uncharacterized protein n=1 Tax=Actinoplanes nipponensis TaxID=135950 RepID=A0A919MVW0_9ACTN|nr:hypothetical protein Ani05nite_51090 [Actinoplanes nipponensis]
MVSQRICSRLVELIRTPPEPHMMAYGRQKGRARATEPAAAIEIRRGGRELMTGPRQYAVRLPSVTPRESWRGSNLPM